MSHTEIVRKARKFATQAHADTNHRYGEHPYEVHLAMVESFAIRFMDLLDNVDDRTTAIAGAWVHDSIEDARMTYNDVKDATNEAIAEVAYALTNEKGRTRKERANDRYYAGIRANRIATYVKICDRLANVTYSKNTQSRMLDLYRKELPDFRDALYTEKFNPMWVMLEDLLA